MLPGDKLVFTTRYTNSGPEAATDFVVTNPLPAPVKLAKVDSFEVSVDGGKTFGALAALKATGTDGKSRAAEAGRRHACSLARCQHRSRSVRGSQIFRRGPLKSGPFTISFAFNPRAGIHFSGFN